MEHAKTAGIQKYGDNRRIYHVIGCLPCVNLPILSHGCEGIGVPIVEESGHYVIMGVEQEGGQLGLGADPASQDHGFVGDKL